MVRLFCVFEKSDDGSIDVAESGELIYEFSPENLTGQRHFCSGRQQTVDITVKRQFINVTQRVTGTGEGLRLPVDSGLSALGIVWRCACKRVHMRVESGLTWD